VRLVLRVNYRSYRYSTIIFLIDIGKMYENGTILQLMAFIGVIWKKKSFGCLFVIRSCHFEIKKISFSIYVKKIQERLSQFLLRRFALFHKKALKSGHIISNITTSRSLFRVLIRILVFS